MTSTTRRAIQILFYGGFCILLLLIVTTIIRTLIPGFATRISYNSEAYFFAVFLGAWIQFALPQLPHHRRLPWALVVGAIFALFGMGLLLSDLPSRIRTLNESSLALAILIPYVSLSRPLPRWTLLATPILIVLTMWAVAWAPQSWVIDQAETFGFLVLAMLTLDFFDRVLLEPEAQVNVSLRASWYVFTIIEPVVVSALGTDIRTGGGTTALVLEYLGRIHESFVGLLLVALILHLVPGYRSKLSAL